MSANLDNLRDEATLIFNAAEKRQQARWSWLKEFECRAYITGNSQALQIIRLVEQDLADEDLSALSQSIQRAIADCEFDGS